MWYSQLVTHEGAERRKYDMESFKDCVDGVRQVVDGDLSKFDSRW